MRYVIV